MVDAATEAASDLDCDVETTVEELFRGFRLRAHLAAGGGGHARARVAGDRAEPVTTGGGSDANALIAAGLPTANVANGTERNHQPDESVTVAGAGEDAGRDPGDRGGGGAGELRADRQRGGLERQDRRRSGSTPSAIDDGEEADREVVAHPGAVGIVAHDGERIYLVRQPREAVGEQSLLELPAGKLEEGEEPLETAKRELAEEIGKGAEQLGAPDLVLDLAGLRRRGVPPVPGHRPLRPSRGVRRGRADRDRDRRRSTSSTT